MIETAMAIGIMAGTFGLVGVMFCLMIKMYGQIIENSRDIKFIKTVVHMNNNCGCYEDPQKEE